MIETYVASVEREFKTGIAQEHAYRPALKRLIEASKTNIIAVNDPSHSEGGAPDFIVTEGILPIAFFEAKDIGKNLDKIDKNEQMGRYKAAYGNLILTDYLEFRWYLDGEHVETVRIGEKTGTKLHWMPDKYGELESLLGRVMNTVMPTVHSPEELAAKMAHLARDISRLILILLRVDEPSEQLQNTLIKRQTRPPYIAPICGARAAINTHNLMPKTSARRHGQPPTPTALSFYFWLKMIG